jgi:metal-responsive CopG/Arc/MetJ family transcriptional regulator
MTLSVRLDTFLEKELEQTARKQGVTKSKFVVDLIERALGHKDPHALMLEMRKKYGLLPPSADRPQTNRSENTSIEVRKILKQKYDAMRTG